MNSPDPSPDRSDEILPAVYDELRALAGDFMRRERADHTLQPTALVHEAYLRLARLDHIEWRDEGHFRAAAAGAIRRVLVDHARARASAKRLGGAGRLTLSAVDPSAGGEPIDVLELDDALEKLAGLAPRKARVVELRFFAGLSIAEAAEALDIGTTTVEDDWAFARSWLGRELGRV